MSQVVISWMLVAAGCGDEGGPLPTGQSGTLAGKVLVSGPLRGASVAVDQLDLETGEVALHVGDATTDDEGRFALDTGTANGLVLVTTSGGMFVDRATGATIQLDATDHVETIVPVELLEEVSDVLVSPVGHLIAARTRYKLTELGLAIDDAFADATDHLNDHFGNVDWLRVAMADLRQPAASPTEPVRAALVHTALSYLVQDIATVAGASPQEANVYRLAQLWAEDIGAGVFDGNDDNEKGAVRTGALQLGVCPPVEEPCEPPANTTCLIGACRTLCDLYVGTPRALLGGVVTKVIANREINGTNLATADIIPVARAISESVDDDLFGNACIETLDRLAPTLQFSADSPGDGAYVRGTRAVKVTAIDDVDPNPVARFPDFAETDGDPNNNVAVASIDTTKVTDGTLTILAVASDLSGNTGTAARVVIVDNTAPVVQPAATGFFVDGTTWWTASSTPTITGTLTEPNPMTVKAKIGASEYAGTLGSGTFSVTLPANAIDLAGRDVTIVVTDLAGNEGQATRRIRYDATPPSLGLQNATMFDERTETVEFTNDPGNPGNHEIPRHLHGGTPIDLGITTACPVVTKHSYLLGAASARYGIELPQPNPIRYPLLAGDDGVGIAAMTTQYRVIRRGTPDTVVRDWAAVPPGTIVSPGTLRHDVGIYDGPVAGLATTEATYDVELRATDRLGRTTTLARCFELALKAPPMHFTEGGPATGLDMALDLLTLAPMSGQHEKIAERMLNPGGTGASLVGQRFVNGTASTVHLTLTIVRPTVTGMRQFRHAARLDSPVNIADVNCSRFPTAVCTNPLPPNTYVSGNGPSGVTGPVEIRAKVFETTAGGAIIAEVPCVAPCDAVVTTYRFAIPPRSTATGATPRYFTAMTMLNPQPSLYPTDAVRPSQPLYSDGFLVGSIAATGKLANPSAPYCSTYELRPHPTIPDEFEDWCTHSRTYRTYHALLDVRLDFVGPTQMESLTSPTATIPPAFAASQDRLAGQWARSETPFP